MNSFVEVVDLNKRYRSKRGIKDISFSFNKGQVFALLGPNGAGKTTIMKAMIGLNQKSKGNVYIDGIDLVEEREKALYKIGAIIGPVVSYEYLTAFQNLKLKANYYSLDNENIEEILKTVGLIKHRDEKVKIFSTGMKQRLGIALALLSNPEVLILDEPFTGMDIEGKRQMRILLAKLAKTNNIAILISSHIISEIETVYTNVAILEEGLIIDQTEKRIIDEKGICLEDFYMDVISEYRSEDALVGIEETRRYVG